MKILGKTDPPTTIEITEIIEIIIYIETRVIPTILSHTSHIDRYREYKQPMHTLNQPADQTMPNHTKESQLKQ